MAPHVTPEDVGRLLEHAQGRPPTGRGIFCNRTLNLRSIQAIGYDMDYTLIHYNVQAWEERAYEAARRKLTEHGWPVTDLTFDPAFVLRGLIIDTVHGNIVKANRFGYVKRAYHGMQPMAFEDQRARYGRTIVDLAEPRWRFLNTLFAVSEACLYAQLTEKLDRDELEGVRDYVDLYARVRQSLDEAHMEGALKAEIVASPERFVELDEDTPRALLDQREAGKRLLLITNSGWPYTREMMRYAFDPFMPPGTTWRDLFEVVIVSARKPTFFSHPTPIFKIVDEAGLLTPASGITAAGLYLGGHAGMVERYLSLSGSRILYVGDHIYGDVHVSKSLLRWRTALIIRELEQELAALEGFRHHQDRLAALMDEKVSLESQVAQLRLVEQRRPPGLDDPQARAVWSRALDGLRARLVDLDQQITPLAIAASQLHNPHWGLLMRAGNDKSHLARQIERHADIYTSRVSNLLFETPFGYLRSSRGSLPHDPQVWMPHGTDEGPDHA